LGPTRAHPMVTERNTKKMQKTGFGPPDISQKHRLFQ
jgi:hypothetical protein